MDWNVFFSTVSQTAGAIVGIFAAFLITKIVANQSEFSTKKERIAQFLHRSQSLRNETKTTDFERYNASVANMVIKKTVKVNDITEEILSAEQYYHDQKLNFSPFQSYPDALKMIQKKIDELHEKKSSEPTNDISVAIYLNETMEKDKDKIYDLLLRVLDQASLNDALLADIRKNPESSTLVSVSIIATLLLFFSGVIYPLSFLPLKPNEKISLSFGAFFDILFSFKGAFLVLLSVIFGSLLIKFLYVNINLRHDKHTMEKLQFFANEENYSPYFKNYNNYNDEIMT